MLNGEDALGNLSVSNTPDDDGDKISSLDILYCNLAQCISI